MLKKYLNRSLLALSVVAIGAISAFAVGGDGPSQVEIVLQKPTIVMSGVQGTARVVSILKAAPTDSVVYRTSDTIATYHDPFLVEKTDVILARTCATDTVYDAKGNQIVKHYYSEYDTLMVKAGTEVKLNPVTFDQNMVELVDDLSYITLHTDQSDVLLNPEATIMYRMTNRTWIEVPNDSTVLSNEGTIAAYAKAPGYANSDTTYYNVKIQRIEYVGVPSIEILEHNADGSKKLLIKNTVKGYPVPTIYYSFPAGAEPLALEDSILVTPAGSFGWLQVYADAPGYDASEANRIYLDNRTEYKEPYVTVLPGDTTMATIAGDLELWNVQDLDVTNYPEQAVQVNGSIIYHKTMHSGYNTIVLPFLYLPSENKVTDAAGNILAFNEDFHIYSLSSTLTPERLIDGSLAESKIYPFKSYLIQVDSRLIGQDIVFWSKPKTALDVSQNSFSSSSQDLTFIPNARAQKYQTNTKVFIINKSGTAFELEEKPNLAAFDVAAFASSQYMEKNSKIVLTYLPDLEFSPVAGTEMSNLSEFTITCPSLVHKMILTDNSYLINGNKHLSVKKNGVIQPTLKPQLNCVDEKTYKVVFNVPIQNEGIYETIIPSELFGFYMTGNSTDNPNYLSVETIASYNVMTPTTVSISPNEGTQTTLKDFVLTFNKTIGLNNNCQDCITLTNLSGEVFASFSTDYIKNRGWISDNILKLSLPQTIETGGSYKLTIPKDFLTISNVFTNSQAFVFDYILPVVRRYKEFTEDTILWTDSVNILKAYNEGWASSDDEGSFVYETIPSYIPKTNPVDKNGLNKSVEAVIVHDSSTKILHLYVKNVKTIIIYGSNQNSWAYALDISAESDKNLFTKFASIEGYSSGYCRVDLIPDQEFEVTAYCNAAPLDIYAVEIVYRDGSISGNGIDSIINDTETNNAIFDLNGYKVNNPQKDKLYIKNGKKYMIH